MNRFILFIFLLLSLSSCKRGKYAVVAAPVYQGGDDRSWAKATYDDQHWSKERIRFQDRIYWVRSKVELLNSSDDLGHVGLNINGFGAFEVYWDGMLIGKNGTVEQSGRQEVPGTESSCFLIPDSLATKGSHQLAVRVSQAYLSDDLRNVVVYIGPYDQLIKGLLVIASFMNVTAGVFLIAALYYFFIFINNSRKDASALIFCVTCFLFFTLLLTEYSKVYITIPYPQFYLRLKIIGFLTFVIALLIPLYFSIQFHFKRKFLLLGLLLLALLSIYGYNLGHYDITAWYFGCAMWVFSFVIVGNAIFQKENGAGVVMAGLLVSALIDYFLYYDFSLFISFNIIILCMLYLHTIRTRDAENDYRSALLLSARLKTELLKKNIQPHFIKNTLTSLIDWVEESPKQGVVFIQALSAEFDLLNEIANATLIPIEREIALCKIHLKVMEFRKEVSYDWFEEGIDATELIPPAILHTILENGITHSKPLTDGSIRFQLSFKREQKFKQYSLLTIAENRESKHRKEGGTGFLYIKARLRESYGDQWAFTSEKVNEGWLTIIKIYI